MVTDARVKDSPFLKPIPRQFVILGIAASVGIVGITGLRVLNIELPQPNSAKESQVSQAVVPQVKTVTALGRLEPAGEVIKLSPPASSQGSRVEQLLVKEGDSVKLGQVIAILDNRDRPGFTYQVTMHKNHDKFNRTASTRKV